MKKMIMIAAAALVLGACGRTEKVEQVAAEETAKAGEVLTSTAATVVDLADDNAYRPDTKVDRLTILDFNATWCGPCKQLKPVFEQAASSFPQVAFVSVDVDNNPATAQAFDVEAVPTVVLLRPDGKSVRYVGTDELLPASAFTEIVIANLK